MNKNKTTQQLSEAAVSGSVISSTHLRVGNLVTFMDETLKIRAIFENGIHDERYNGYGFNEITPIPITEELLLKLGAVKLDFKTFPCFNYKGMQINCVRGMWIEYVSQLEINGLHHLQNIFYFRMAEELDVSALTDR